LQDYKLQFPAFYEGKLFGIHTNSVAESYNSSLKKNGLRCSDPYNALLILQESLDKKFTSMRGTVANRLRAGETITNNYVKKIEAHTPSEDMLAKFQKYTQSVEVYESDVSKAKVKSFREGSLSYLSTLNTKENRTDCTCQVPKTKDHMCKHNMMHIKTLLDGSVELNTDELVPTRYRLEYIAKVYGLGDWEVRALKVQFNLYVILK
jgi:hypothetical protein